MAKYVVYPYKTNHSYLLYLITEYTPVAVPVKLPLIVRLGREMENRLVAAFVG